jgi:hypothetical protein
MSFLFFVIVIFFLTTRIRVDSIRMRVKSPRTAAHKSYRTAVRKFLLCVIIIMIYVQFTKNAGLSYNYTDGDLYERRKSVLPNFTGEA